MRNSESPHIKIFFFVIALVAYNQAKAQLSIGSSESFSIQPQKGSYTYTVYWYPFSDYMLKHLRIHEKTITEKGEVKNGLMKRKIEFDGAKLISTETSFYKDSLLVKYIRKYTGVKHSEIYNYKYSHVTKEHVYTRGTKNGKLIYSVIQTRLKDSIIKRTIYNDESLKVKEKDVTYYSPDSLVQTTAVYVINSKKAYYQIKKYASKNVMAEEIDSSDNDVRQEKYFYDGVGRISEKRSYNNSVLNYVTEYKYEDCKTIISNYQFYEGKKGQISDEHLSLYDKNGLLVYEKITDYDKLEGIISDGKTVVPEPTVEAGLVIIKCYQQNRLVQFQIFHGDKVGNCYEIEYR